MAQVKKAATKSTKEAATKKTTAKKTTAKKTTAKKTTSAVKKTAATVKTKIELQYGDKDISYDEIVKNAKNYLTKELGMSAADLKSLDLYVKPEENRVYYVANGKDAGSFEL